MKEDAQKKDSNWIKFENHLLNEGLSDLRLRKLKSMHSFVLRHIKKPLNNLSREDIETFLDDLNRNIIRKKSNEEFSGSTKSDVKKFLKQYFKWLKGNNEEYPREVSWIKVRIRKDEKPLPKDIIKPEEVMKLANEYTKIEHRLVTLLLFDSGFRINEMLSVRKEDIVWREDGENSCYWIRCRESKTIAREVPIPLFTEEINSFLNSTYFRSKDQNSLLFDVSHRYYCASLGKYSEKLFSKHITPHALRHSSATYYAKEYEGNMLLLCQRYGWTLNSNQAQTYVRNSGTMQKLGLAKVQTNRVTELVKKLEEYEKRLSEIEKVFQSS